jgi:hypothetical protein
MSLTGNFLWIADDKGNDMLVLNLLFSHRIGWQNRLQVTG